MNVVTKDNYGPNLAGLWAQAFLLEEAPLAEMLAAAEHADTVGAVASAFSWTRTTILTSGFMRRAPLAFWRHRNYGNED